MKQPTQQNTSLQVSEGASNKTVHLPLSGPLTQSEHNQHIEEQGNPQVNDPTQQQAQEQEPPSVPVVSPELHEETPPTTRTRSGRSVRPTA